MNQEVAGMLRTMEELIEKFPENITEGVELAKRSAFKTPEHEINSIVICGMGGSGIGAQLVSGWVADELKVSIQIVNEYTVPSYVSKNTLVIGSSYSGNTEETIAAIEDAMSRNAHIICVCSGGKLAEICEENNFDKVIVPGGNPPRTALAYSIIQLLNIFSRLGLITDKIDQMISSRDLIVKDKAIIQQKAHELAAFLNGNVGILYGTTKYGAVLVRARQQFNENSKYLCWHHTIPEMNHNELVGWGGGDQRFASVFFEADDLHRRNRKRLEITKEVVQKRSGQTLSISAKGENLIERSIYMISIVDWASLYLAEIKDQDPIDIAVIDYLKGSLANFK